MPKIKSESELTMLILAICQPANIIKAKTPGRIEAKRVWTCGLHENCLSNFEIKMIITTDGKTNPKVAMMLPKIPAL